MSKAKQPPKTEMILVRMDAKTRLRLVRAAKKMGYKSVSEYVRQSIKDQMVIDLNLSRW